MRSRCKEVVSSSSHDLSILVDESGGVVIPWLVNHDMDIANLIWGSCQYVSFIFSISSNIPSVYKSDD